jgi:hypothetical protein
MLKSEHLRDPEILRSIEELKGQGLSPEEIREAVFGDDMENPELEHHVSGIRDKGLDPVLILRTASEVIQKGLNPQAILTAALDRNPNQGRQSHRRVFRKKSA